MQIPQPMQSESITLYLPSISDSLAPKERTD
jgi:hypothetical protein